MPRKRSPARLVIALSVAAVLAVFLLYTSLAGGTVKLVTPSQLSTNPGKVELQGIVQGKAVGDAHNGGLRFRLKDVNGSKSVPVVYTGVVPDLFAPGRRVYLQGRIRGGVFVGDHDTLVTKCPSKYVPKKA